MIQSQYLSPSEAQELRTICSDLSTPPDDLKEWESEESEYKGRSAYAAAVVDASDPCTFFEGGAGYGLHPRHAAHVNRHTVNRYLGWGGWR